MMKAAVLLLAAALTGAASAAPPVHPEVRIITDEVTHVTMRFLTTAPSNDAKLYQTHPQWTADGSRIVFRSTDRSPEGPEIFAVREKDGAITQLTHGTGVRIGSINLSRRTNRLFYLRDGDDHRVHLMALDIPGDLETGGVPKEQSVATLPEGFRDAGGFALDADETAAYTGVLTDDAPSPQIAATRNVTGAIWAVDLKTGAVRTIITTPFRVGHVEANPFVPGEIMYCHETGGDAPQRMWIVQSDGSGNRPLFVEGPTDWVTHETFVDRDHVMFNLMGHRPELRKRPTGVAVINLRTDGVEMVGQLPTGGGFWHSSGTPDGRLAVADDFAGEIYVINRLTGERVLVSTGHVMKPDHAHPNFSPDGTRILIESGRLSGGKSLDLVILPVPQRLLAGPARPLQPA
jgi:Oligogalacturonate lyase/WD40-like Beta Propeller Repeat